VIPLRPNAVSPSPRVQVTFALPADATGIALLREARRRAPGDFWANYHLAKALTTVSQVNPEVARYFAAAAAIRPDLPLVRGKLAFALTNLGEFQAALTVLREEAKAHPADGSARSSLARYLGRLGELDEAIDEYRNTLRLKPNLYAPRSELVLALLQIGDRAGALAEARAWVAEHGTDLNVHRQLIIALTGAGHFAEALTEARRQPIGRVNEGWSQFSLAEAERLADIAKRVAAAPDPAGLPVAPEEAWEYVRVCSLTGHEAAAVRYTGLALTANKPPSRSGLLAGVTAAVRLGTGSAGAGLTPAERARYRVTALEWLRLGLVSRDAGLVGRQAAFRRMTSREYIRSWDFNRDLAVVRDPEALARLPGLERAGWTKLWADAAAKVRSLDRGEDDGPIPSPIVVPPVRVVAPIKALRPK
jgi:Flp pilus assembly protein TadD